MKAIHDSNNSPHLATCVAPDDLNCGDFVAVLNVVCELPSFLWCCESSGVEPDEPVRIKFQSGGGTPLKIKAICLPFVYVKSPDGTSRTMDVRQVQLARLNPDYATAVWKEMKKQPRKKFGGMQPG